MKRIAGFSILALVLSASLVDCSKKSGEEYDELYDTTAIKGAVKYIDTVPASVALKHPGGLNVTEDFDRIKAAISANNPDIIAGYNKLAANSHAQLSYSPGAVDTLIRGGNSREQPKSDNYSKAFNDAAAAYQLALRWKIDGDTRYADRAILILNAWASTCKALSGDPNVFLAAGFYGYQFAQAGELMRDYAGWAKADFTAFQNWMLTVFYPLNHRFLIDHNNTCADHYWANWDLGNIASVMSIGILTDKRTLYNEAVNYLQRGAGNGNLRKAIWYVYEGQDLAQLQESGRDQGHASLVVAMLGTICEIAWHQGDDFYGFGNNLVLKGAEYNAKYNSAWETVPYQPYAYKDCDTTIMQNVISEEERGDVRPIYTILYGHYVKRKGLKANYIQNAMNKSFPEGGGGDYSPNSGGYDQLGFGTLLYTRP